jgi:hypothetical protein
MYLQTLNCLRLYFSQQSDTNTNNNIVYFIMVHSKDKYTNQQQTVILTGPEM